MYIVCAMYVYYYCVYANFVCMFSMCYIIMILSYSNVYATYYSELEGWMMALNSHIHILYAQETGIFIRSELQNI